MLEAITKYYENESMFHGFIPRIMGTRFDLLLIHPDSARMNDLWTKIINELERLDKMLNRFDTNSEVSWLNSLHPSAPTLVSEEFMHILQLCRSYYESSLHLFDITLKDFSLVRFHDNQSISFANSELSLDFGGFAKGYALNKIKDFLVHEEIANAFVDFGNSSILGMGHHPYGDCWKVSFQNPYNGVSLHEFNLRDSALSTSGNTLQYSGHILNPLTGTYEAQRKAATILSDNPLEAEVFSTVWMIANETQRLQLSENLKNIQATLYNL